MKTGSIEFKQPAVQIPKMVVADLDGTLLNSNLAINPKDLQTLHELGQQEIVRVIATGRTLYSFNIANLGHIPYDYLIFTNGAGVICNKKSSLIHKQYFNKIQTTHMIHTLIDSNVDFIVMGEVPDNHFCKYYRKHENNVRFENRINYLKAFSSSLEKKDFYDFHTTSFAIFDDNFPVLEAKTYYESIFPDTNIIAVTDDDRNQNHSRIELFPSQSSKAKAVEWLAKSLNIQKESIMVIGNDYNDISMLDWAKHSYIVSNSKIDLKSNYQMVGSNDENGFSEATFKWLQRINND